MTDARAQRILPIALALLFAVAAVGPIRNYDFFWHLATGRWIVEHAALPQVDPFAVASDKHDWINGEWLFEVAAYGLHELVGLSGMSFVRALLAAAIFTLVFFLSGRNLLATSVAFAGAMQTFDLRPSSVAMLFVVIAIALGGDDSRRARFPVLHFVNSMLWINVHPSALLAPGIAALSTRRVAPVIASAIGLLVNPHGWRAIAAPLELMSFVRSGAFVNAEWLPSAPTQFPLLYLLVIGGAIALVVKREDWGKALLFAGFAYLAIRHVRNQPLFFAAFPLLVPRFEPRRALSYAASAAAILLVALTADHRLGVAPERFPLHAVAKLRAMNVAGNIYNPDQFGGFVIWSFYPQRRALTDGRNELYRNYIFEYARARGDERAWRALLRKYRIDLAVDEQRPPLPVIDARTGARRDLPASLVYWPPREWALIASEEAGMAFARRAAFPAEVIAKWEIAR
ncbi:MAG TPA: hypothetical protein VF846_14190 [Thermoanaerobaculia bacterium]